MSGVVKIARRKPQRGFMHSDRSARRRLCAPIIAVELTYVLALVIAVPIGQGAVALTITLAFLLATVVGARMSSSHSPT